jgi:hypothetical protein
VQVKSATDVTDKIPAMRTYAQSGFIPYNQSIILQLIKLGEYMLLKGVKGFRIKQGEAVAADIQDIPFEYNILIFQEKSLYNRKVALINSLVIIVECLTVLS